MNYPCVYAVKHKDFETRMASRSGGIFTALSDYILEKQGVVFGCVLDENFQAYHLRAETSEERNLMRGSKYIQSQLLDCFKAVKTDLLNERNVMFTGTSCQIAGLKSFLGKDYEKLITIDILCFGVPSSVVWRKYIEWQESRNNGKCVKVNFRNKKDFGWSKHIETLTFEDSTGKRTDVSSNVFATIFSQKYSQRPCCYKCPYKSIMHPGDITIADYWGIDNAAPGFNDNKGVSLVLINNEKGKELFEKVKEAVSYVETDIEKSMQPALKAPFEKPAEREQFWKDLHKKSFDRIARKYGTRGFMFKVKRKLRKIFGH